jgi:hypothetical protein
MTLIKRTAQPDPRICGWLADHNSTAFQRRIVERAMLDVGILETPLASNRGVRIDAYTKRAGLPIPKNKTTGEGWWWCAIWAGAVLIDSGSYVPQDYAACDSWLPYLDKTPTIGSAVLYGVRGDAHHIGIIARLEPMVLTIEGNRGYAGTTNNGIAVDIGPMMRRDILGYFHPRSVNE